MTTILGIKLDDRCENAQILQKILTKFGNIIQTRIGLHSICNSKNNFQGVVLLEISNNNELKELETQLCNIKNIEIQKMVFN